MSAPMTVITDPKWYELADQLEGTPRCSHLSEGTAYQYDCAWCQINRELDGLERAEYRRQHVRGRR